MSKTMMTLVVALVLAGGVITPMILVSSGEKIKIAKANNKEIKTEAEEDEESHAEEKGDKKGEKKVKTPFYFEFDKPIVVNLDGSSGVRFLQVSVALMTFTEANVEKMKTHMPVIRHNLVLLFSSQNFTELQSIAGKKKLQKESLALVRKELKRVTGEALVDELYLPSIIGQ